MIPTLLTLALSAPPKITRPPAIAKVAGITLGLTTVEDFERKYGKSGYLTSAGKRQPGRVWFDQTSGTVILSLRNRRTKDGTIIDDLSIDWESKSQIQKSIPTIHLPPSTLGLLTKLKKGMTLGQIEASLKAKLPNAELTAKGLIQYPTQITGKQTNRYTQWKADLVFQKNKLIGFQTFAN